MSSARSRLGERVGVVGRLRPLAEELDAADRLGGAAHVDDLLERRLGEPLARHVVAARRPDPRVDDAVYGLAAAPVLAAAFGHAREADAEDDAVGRTRGREVRVGDARERGVAPGVEHERRLGVELHRRRAVDEHLGVAGGGDGVEVGFGESLLVGELLAVGLAEHGDAERGARAAVGRALEKGELGVGAEQAAREAGGGVLEIDLDAALGGDEAARGEGDLGRGVVDHVVSGFAALQELAVEVDALGAGEHHDKRLAGLPAKPVRPLHGFDGCDFLALVEAARDGAGHAHPPPGDEPVPDARHVGRDGGALDFAAEAGELARAVGEVHVAEAGLAGARVELDVDAVELGEALRGAVGLDGRVLVGEDGLELDAVGDFAREFEPQAGFQRHVAPVARGDAARDGAAPLEPARAEEVGVGGVGRRAFDDAERLAGGVGRGRCGREVAAGVAREQAHRKRPVDHHDGPAVTAAPSERRPAGSSSENSESGTTAPPASTVAVPGTTAADSRNGDPAASRSVSRDAPRPAFWSARRVPSVSPVAGCAQTGAAMSSSRTDSSRRTRKHSGGQAGRA